MPERLRFFILCLAEIVGIADGEHLLWCCRSVEGLVFLFQPFKLSGGDVLRTFLAVALHVRVEFIAANPAALHPLGNGNHQRMEMRGGLVEVAFEADDILLAELAAEEVVVVHGHCLDHLHAGVVGIVGKTDPTVVLLPVEVHRLAESDLRHAVVVTAKYEIDAGVRLVRRVLPPRFEVQFLQSLLVSFLQRLPLSAQTDNPWWDINCLAVPRSNLLTTHYLKVEMSSRPVVAVARLLVLGLIGFLSPVTTLVLPALGSRERSGCRYVQRLVLFQ